jgi:hypothetical protein
MCIEELLFIGHDIFKRGAGNFDQKITTCTGLR